jgi:hypothetical protein
MRDRQKRFSKGRSQIQDLVQQVKSMDERIVKIEGSFLIIFFVGNVFPVTASALPRQTDFIISQLKSQPVSQSPQKPSSTELPKTELPKTELPKLDPRIEPRIDFKVDPKITPLKPNIPIESDPELGIIRPSSRPSTPQPAPLSPIPSDPDFDPELGTIKIRPSPLPKRPQPKSLYLLGRLDYFQSSNIFASTPLTSDGSLRSGLTLYYAPALGPQTYLLATAESSLLRYGVFSRLNYDELRFKAGIYQQLTPRVSGELGWSYQQLTAAKENLLTLYQGSRFFNEHSFRLDLTRQDPLTSQLKLVTGYQLRWNLTGDVEKYDRLINSGFVSMSYALSPRMQAGIDYQGTWTHFLQQSRDDVTHYVGMRLSYGFTDRISINAFGGRSMGNSSDRRLDLNSWVFGMGIAFNVPIF